MAEASGKQGLGRVRRRLSVVSDNTLIEGMSEIAVAEGATAGAGTAGSVIVEYAGVSEKGYAPYNPRKKNQDSLIMVADAATNSMMLGVLDGHGEAGDKVSQHFRDRLPDLVFKDSNHPAKVEKALANHFDALEQKILKDTSVDTEFSGTTAVVGVITGDKLTVANIGDSRLILGSLDDKGVIRPTEVSIDHKPDGKGEKERIIAKGGRVFAIQYDDGVDGPARVWLAHMDIPGLAMSRSLGDTVAHSAGVISTPECFQKKLSPKDKILCVASDGLWEFMSNEEVIDIIKGQDSCQAACDVLVKEAKKRWMKEEQVVDDTTVCVAYLDVK